MNKKIIKKAILLYNKGLTIREVRLKLIEYYKISITYKEVNNLLKPIYKQYNQYSDYQIELILYLYSNFYNTEKVAEYLNTKYNMNLTVCGIKTLASRNKVKKKLTNMYAQSFITREDEKHIIELYNQGKTGNDIAKIYGYKTSKSIYDKLEKLNAKRRSSVEHMKLNRTYLDFTMDIINTAEKAYFLGLMLSDGYINEDRGYIQLDLTDLDVIEYISECINVKYTIIYPTNPKHKLSYRITLYGEEYVNSVRRLGLVQNKSLTLQNPVLNNEEIKFIPYILRGIIDGDGWIRKDGKEFFISSASEDFIKWCYNQMILLGFKSIKYKFIPNDTNGIYIIRTGVKENIELLKAVVYDKPFGMMRKYNRL